MVPPGRPTAGRCGRRTRDARRGRLSVTGRGEHGATRRFTLAEHIRVSGASHQDGMLHIDLVREVPEALKPRKIEIGKGAAKAVETIDA